MKDLREERKQGSVSTPIFVVGKHRSGTTLLGNLLLDHPEIAGVRHEAHEGIHESAYFSHVEDRYGDLSIAQNYMEFASVMSKSDYFTLAGVGFEDLLELYPSTYAEVFRYVMNRVAEQEEASFWVEKTPMHTELISRIGSYYPDARFVGIRRNVVSTALSMLHLKNRQDASPVERLGYLLRVAADKYLLDHYMNMARREWPDRVLIVEFEGLVSKQSTILSHVCSFLSLDHVGLESRFPRNSSFKESKTVSIRGYEKWVLLTVYKQILPRIPAALLRSLKRTRHRNPLPKWFFKVLKDTLGDSTFAASRDRT
mgnify:FL=1